MKSEYIEILKECFGPDDLGFEYDFELNFICGGNVRVHTCRGSFVIIAFDDVVIYEGDGRYEPRYSIHFLMNGIGCAVCMFWRPCV